LSFAILVIDDQIYRSKEEQLLFLRSIGEISGHGSKRRQLGRYAVTFCSGQIREHDVIINDAQVALNALSHREDWTLILLDMQFDSGIIGPGDIARGTPEDRNFGLVIEQAILAYNSDLPVIHFSGQTEHEINSRRGPYLAKLNLNPQEFRLALLAYGSLTLDQKRDILELEPDTLMVSQALLDVYARALKLTQTDAPVLILGETGVGKERLARYLHKHSTTGNAPFLAVNVAAIPEHLIDAELFGHERGAFTGAEKQKKGLFEQAAGGTIFLDEIGDMPLDHQIRLLRVLQERQFRRVGGSTEIPFTGRVLLATHRNPQLLIRQGLFRADLYNRLTHKLFLPPLRERPEEILPLAEHFLAAFAKHLGKNGLTLNDSARDTLLDYDFPGNIRELAALMQELALETGNNRVIYADMLALPEKSSLANGRKLISSRSLAVPITPQENTASGMLSLDDLESIVREVDVQPSDRYLPGIKPRLENALQSLLLRCASACLNKCRHPVSGKLRLLPAMQLLTGDPGLKGTGAKRTMNELLGRKVTETVRPEDLESLCSHAQTQALNSAETGRRES
jgi:transcriptional regulator with AAA-type ATPase domain